MLPVRFLDCYNHSLPGGAIFGSGKVYDDIESSAELVGNRLPLTATSGERGSVQMHRARVLTASSAELSTPIESLHLRAQTLSYPVGHRSEPLYILSMYSIHCLREYTRLMFRGAISNDFSPVRIQLTPRLES